MSRVGHVLGFAQLAVAEFQAMNAPVRINITCVFGSVKAFDAECRIVAVELEVAVAHPIVLTHVKRTVLDLHRAKDKLAVRVIAARETTGFLVGRLRVIKRRIALAVPHRAAALNDQCHVRAAVQALLNVVRIAAGNVEDKFAGSLDVDIAVVGTGAFRLHADSARNERRRALVRPKRDLAFNRPKADRCSKIFTERPGARLVDDTVSVLRQTMFARRSVRPVVRALEGVTIMTLAIHGQVLARYLAKPIPRIGSLQTERRAQGDCQQSNLHKTSSRYSKFTKPRDELQLSPGWSLPISHEFSHTPPWYGA